MTLTTQHPTPPIRYYPAKTPTASPAPSPARPPAQGANGTRGASPRLWPLLPAGLAAAGVLAAWRNVQRARRAERDNPPMGQFVQGGPARLHYVERGQGRGTCAPIVLIHGNGSMVQDWDSSGLIDLLAGDHRVIAVDRPGYGYSTRPRGTLWSPQAQAAAIGDGLRRLGVERPILVGHSWGTLVALAMAMQAPEQVAGLVLLSGYYYPTARADVPIFSTPAIPGLGDAMRYTVSPYIGRAITPKVLDRIFEPKPVPPRFRAEFPVEMALRPSQIRASAQDTAFMTPSTMVLSRGYKALSMPVAIMAGADDKIVDVGRHAERLHRELPGSSLTLVPGAGHMVHHAAAREVCALAERMAAKVCA